VSVRIVRGRTVLVAGSNSTECAVQSCCSVRSLGSFLHAPFANGICEAPISVLSSNTTVLKRVTALCIDAIPEFCNRISQVPGKPVWPYTPLTKHIDATATASSVSGTHVIHACNQPGLLS
jgi:hypothetical protein